MVHIGGNMRIWLLSVFYFGVFFADAWENLLFGQTYGEYGTILTDGQRETSCIVGNDTTRLNIRFNLEKNYSIKSVRIFFKESNGSEIELTTTDFISWRFYHMLDETPAEVTFLGQRESSIIYFAIDPVNQINVCEIEALGCEKGFYGENCTKCDLPANCETCDVTNGSCYRCHRNFTGPNCLQENNNLLLGGQYLPFAGYSYGLSTGLFPLDPLLMTDGNIDESMCQKLEGFPKRLSIRIEDRVNYSLNVKMINVYLSFKNIQDDENITLHIAAEKFKFGFFNMSTTFNLSSDGVYRIPFAFNTEGVYMDITITYPNTTLPGSLLVCEIAAIGCLPGYYGTPCRPCDISGCATGECHPLDGSCVCGSVLADGTSCWQSLSLGALCKFGLFGKYCNQTCSRHCRYTCHQANGTCIGGCDDGWMSDMCDQVNILFGRTNVRYGTVFTDGLRNTSCILTTGLDIWFDLYQNYSINSVTIFVKEMNGSSIMLRMGNFTSWRTYHMLDETPTEVTFLGQRESSFIDVSIYPQNPVYVCEIEVAGCEKGFYGENCTKCDLPANCESCDVKDGSCYRCHRNFTGPDCLQENNNLILGGRYLVLANYSYDMTGGFPFDPLLMTDGIVEKSMCQNVEGFPRRLLFRIWDDVKHSLNVKMINVYLSFKNIQDDENITIYISAEKYKFGYYNWSSTFNISSDEVYRIPFAFNTNMVYIEITISYSDNTLPGSLLVCEIEAIGCLPGYYGTPCRPCDLSGCVTGECQPLDGSCACGWVPYNATSCSEGALCESGWFGKYCDQRCSSHCNVSNDCYQGNGTCKGGCADGWTSDRCDQGKTDEKLKLVDRYKLLT